MNIITYPITPISENARTYTRRAAVPLRFDCGELLPDFLPDDTDRWNCNLCGSDKTFRAPYVKGDIIPFQTQFGDSFNANPQAPTAGFKTVFNPTNNYVRVALIDGNGNIITDDLNEFSTSFWVGFHPSVGSLQTFFVDTSMLPDGVDCFRLRVTYLKKNEFGATVLDRVIFSEEYKEVGVCENTVLIESIYPNTDCNGNFYGLPTASVGQNIQPYYNSMRIFGEVEFLGETEATEENDRGTVTQRTITRNYRVSSLSVPPYFIKRLSQAIRGQSPNVDGQTYKNFAFDSKQQGRMFQLNLTFDSECRLNNKNCNF
jgi:hypothetical protein